MRPAFKTGDVLISRKPGPIVLPRRPVVKQSRQPAFKESVPGPRTFLGVEAFRAKEIKEKGIKVDLGSIKTSIPVLDDRGNPIRDAQGNVVMKKKNVQLADIGGTILEKFELLEELVKDAKNNQTEILANVIGILDAVNVG